MDEIGEYGERITAALERIRKGLDAVPVPEEDAPSPQEVAGLRAALDEERTANAQLEERVRVLKDRQDTKIAQLEARIGAQQERMAGFDRELQALRETNAELREVAGQLRSAMAANVAEPELVNRAVLAELDALRAARSADIAEVDAVLAELKPLVEEAR